MSIHERSKEVDGKRFVDFELDLFVDPVQHAILTIVEKSTNMLFMQKLPFGKLSKPLVRVTDSVHFYSVGNQKCSELVCRHRCGKWVACLLR